MWTDTAGANNHIFEASCCTCTNNNNNKAFEKKLQFNMNIFISFVKHQILNLMFNKRNKNIFIHYL